MKITHSRNYKYNEDGTIDCEILHVDFGWVPFTASPNDIEQHGRELFDTIKTTHGEEITPFVKNETALVSTPPSTRLKEIETETIRLLRTIAITGEGVEQLEALDVEAKALAAPTVTRT